MSRHVLPGLGVLLLLAPSSAQTQTPTIDHHPVACAVARGSRDWKRGLRRWIA